MKNWKTKLQNIFERIDDWSDDVRYRLEKYDEPDDDVLIQPYIGFGNGEKIIAKGRVLEDEGSTMPSEHDSIWKNLARTYRRFETDEIPHARLRANFRGFEKELVADREGYFDLDMRITEKKNTNLWHSVEFELLEPFGEREIKTSGQILMPPETAKFGVISDIDDTVIKTNVASKLKMLLTTVLSNEHTRAPFEGVSEFYDALQKGKTGDENNPIFYVSSSPWNLYTLLIEFFKKQNIPLGPLFLKDFGTHTIFQASDHTTHKLENIKRVLDAYPHLPFILIGDDGEQDPEIYRRIVHLYPEKIHTVYIRKVREETGNEEEIQKLIEEVQTTGSQIVFAPDSEYAAIHAAGENLIAAEKLPEIHEEKLLDKNSPEELSEEDLL